MPEAFLLQYNHKFRINTAPGTDPGTLTPIAAGITSIDPNNNEETDESFYYDGDGGGSTDVTGIKKVITFEGHRKYGDAAQDFIFGLTNKTGPDRKTDFEWEFPDGQLIKGPVTIVNIKDPGGDANSKGEISFEIHFEGLPEVTAAPST
ncbi:capsid protein [Halobacillus sp. Cin3]|uniref:phage tail tube protein n=1 Tax=Halobacillus sp. Cin3 TaxID=2928441 RepID=UPI00248E8D47|nr:capsid protein [Halobacillus sp. Cin3]